MKKLEIKLDKIKIRKIGLLSCLIYGIYQFWMMITDGIYGLIAFENPYYIDFWVYMLSGMAFVVFSILALRAGIHLITIIWVMPAIMSKIITIRCYYYSIRIGGIVALTALILFAVMMYIYLQPIIKEKVCKYRVLVIGSCISPTILFLINVIIEFTYRLEIIRVDVIVGLIVSLAVGLGFLLILVSLYWNIFFINGIDNCKIKNENTILMIKKYKELLDMGIITEIEFQNKKEELLRQRW